MRKLGFTLLEVIIVVIILSVLISLALPALFGGTTRANVAEFSMMVISIRRAVEQCALMNNGDYSPCDMDTLIHGNNLLMEDPSDSPNSKFRYVVSSDSSPSIDRIQITGLDTDLPELHLITYRFMHIKTSGITDQSFTGSGKYLKYVK